MRILAVTADDDDPALVDELLEQPWLARADRAFVFGGLAAAAAARAAADYAAQDDAWLDAAAAHLLDDAPAPERPPRDRRLSPIVIVSALDPAGFAPLPATERALEIEGAALITAVPSSRPLDDEQLTNAQLWIAGDLPPRALTRAGRVLLGPGDLRGPRRALRVEVRGRGGSAAWLDANGDAVERVPLELADRGALRVRG